MEKVIKGLKWFSISMIVLGLLAGIFGLAIGGLNEIDISFVKNIF